LFRILSYNVHRCLGVDGRLSPHRIADVIASCEPDIVALQELDIRRRRTGGVDQAMMIADILKMDVHFNPALRVMEEEYGDAILTARPSTLVKRGALPSPPGAARIEPRGALWASIDIDGTPVQVVNTHLGLLGAERVAQANALLGEDWLGRADCTGRKILCGDMNAVPRSRAYGRLSRDLVDVQRVLGGRPRATFPTRLPVLRLDHIFLTPGIAVTAVEVIRTPLTRIASDHCPLLADLEITDL
jgi:endonuclease/exonuclease/phosphatase family metal-dependent hydrolase